MEVEIVLEYSEERVAKAVANAVSPDNFKVPKNLMIKTIYVDDKVITKIECEKLSTFISTIDDLLSCSSTAEKAIHTVLK